MIRRIVAGGAIAAALVLAPTAATAATYPAPEDSITTPSSTVVPGEFITVFVGGAPGSEIYITIYIPGFDVTIAGTVTSETKVVGDSGQVSFDVTVPEGATGTMGVTSYIDGVAADTASIEIAAASTGTDTDDEALASTGFENAGLAAGAGALLVAGAGAVFVAARRRQNA